MATFKIPVEYKVWGLVEVEAENAQQALDFAKYKIVDLPLPDDPEYVEDSYVIAVENVEELENYN